MISISEFQNPPAEYRIKPFWFWNGEMKKEEISRQIREMAEKGLGGMFICARQGMTVPYLSEEWFDLVKYACEEARIWGLETWLYDEYPYPSGMSGGEVLLEHPEAEHMILQHKRLEVPGGLEIEEDLGWCRVLFAKAYPMDQKGNTGWDKEIDIKNYIGNLQQKKIYQQTGLTKYNHKRFFSYGPSKVLRITLPEEKGTCWRVEIYMEKAMGDFKYYGGFFDPCNRDAVRTFLDTTHERYKRAVGNQFGITVHGMFSDEVGLLSHIPWSRLLPAEFEKRHGYSLLEHMPAIHDSGVVNAVKIRYDLYETAHALFRSSYHKQVSDWCRNHHLQYATEVPSMRHSTQRYSDIVGGDTAHEKLGKSLEWIYDEYISNYRSNAKAVSSLARQLSRKYAMIESFHSVGWTMTLQDAKWMIDRLGSSGINLYNFHAFYYTIQDITKHDAPPSQFLQNPYWKYYRKLADYVGRMGVMITNTEADIQIAVLDPVASLWTSLGDPFHGFPYRGESEEEKKQCDFIRERWVQVCKSILFHQLDYDHLDGEMLLEAQITDGKICLGKACYSVVVIPPCHCMEAESRKKLQEFTDQGGCVIGMEQFPVYSVDEGEDDQETETAWRIFYEKPSAFFLLEYKEEKLIGLCRKHICQQVSCRVISGDRRAVIGCIRRDAQGSYYGFAANQGKDDVTVKFVWEGADTQISAVWYDLERGELKPVLADNGTVVLQLEGFESRWVRMAAVDFEETGENVKEDAGEVSQGSAEQQAELRIPAGGWWKVRPAGKNICRFGVAQMSLDRNTWKETEVKTFIEQCDSLKLLGRENIRFTGEFGTPKKLKPSYPITCWYRIAFFAEEIFQDLSILMDRKAAVGPYELRVNGTAVDPGRWRSVWVNDQNNQAASISDIIKKGENVVELQITIEKDEDGLRDPLYLWGTFGVSQKDEKFVLTKQPETGRPDGYWCKGFPFYSGTMEYEAEMSLEQLGAVCLPKGAVKIRLNQSVPSYDCIEVQINGTSLGVKAYTPYLWICPPGLLRKDKNRITILVTNTLANMLDGTCFDYERHQLINIEP